MEYYIKDFTWMLNPDIEIVNNITKAIESNGGHCPCCNAEEDNKCPCSNYRLHDKCCCNLYIKKDIASIFKEIRVDEHTLDRYNMLENFNDEWLDGLLKKDN